MLFKSKESSLHVIALAYLLFCFTFLPAQNFRNFSSLTGKKDTPVNCVIQSENGELWIGTASGLVQYNGETTKLFTSNDGLIDNNITALFLQSDHTLWIGHKNGKITLFKNKKFIPFDFNGKLSDEPVSAFCEASGIWIASYGTGISYYNDHKLKQYTASNGLADNSVYTLCTDGKTNVWAGTDAGIIHLDIKNTEPSFNIISMKEGLPDNIVRNLLFSPPGNLYVAMQDAGVCRYDLATNKFKSVFQNWKYGTITAIYSDKPNSIIIGTQQYGLITWSVDPSGKEIIKVIDSKNGLLNNAVNAVFCDRENNLWIATNKGLSEMYQSRISYLTLKSGLLSDKIVAFFIDSKNNHWTSTDKGLIKYSYAADGQTIVNTYFSSEGKSEKQITCMYEDIHGMLWLGTYGDGIYKLDPVTGKQENISEKNGIANNNISFITADKNNNIWISTLGGGICRITETKEKRIIKNYAEQEGLTANYIYRIYCDSKNNIWIGSDGDGLIRFNGETFINESRKNNLKGKTVYSMIEDHSGNIWFSLAEQGIYKYDGTTIKNYSLTNGLRDNNPMAIAAAGNTILTIHPKGIDAFDERTGSFNYFSVSDNDIEPNLNASFTDNAGNVWIGTNSGLIFFRSENIPADTITPIVLLNNLTVQYQSYPLDSSTQFSYHQNNFVFNFSAIWFRSDNKIKFRYKLDGMDNSYFETETKAAAYSNLPPGNYVFLVSAANEEGKWSVPVRYSFSINTPIWQRIWFWIIIALITIIAFYIFIQYRLKILQKEKRILEQKVSIRTEEILKQTKVIEAKNVELERLSIVVRETGNVIIIMDAQGRLEWVNESFEKMNGITLDRLKQLKGETIFDISNNPDIKTIIERCIQERTSVVYESKTTIAESKVIWGSSTLTPIYNELGEIQKLVIIDTDITERKRDEEIIRQKNKDITDSIEYAKKIQNSILPGIDTIKKSLPQSFIFFLQKDIVSGDFYWFTRKDDIAVIAAVDCTGHGVPGAFMSLIGYNLLNQIVNEKNSIDPAGILNELNKEVLKALYRNNPDNTSKDGMDISICTINLKTKEILFAGAMRPLYLFGKNGFKEIKGDKIAIGTNEEDRKNGINFTTHSMQANKGDVFYICSDGYADQFGGINGKKMMTKNFKKMLSEIYTLPFEEQHELIMKYHRQWKGDFEQVDDILVIGFSI